MLAAYTIGAKHLLDSFDIEGDVFVTIFACRAPIKVSRLMPIKAKVKTLLPSSNTWDWVKVTNNVYMLAVSRGSRIGNKYSVEWSCLQYPTYANRYAQQVYSEDMHKLPTVLLRRTFRPKRANLNLTGILPASPAENLRTIYCSSLITTACAAQRALHPNCLGPYQETLLGYAIQ